MLVAAAAGAAAALARRSWAGPAIQATRLALALGLAQFVADATIHMAATGQAPAAGMLCVAAVQQGAAGAEQLLCQKMLEAGQASAVAAVAGKQYR